MQDENSMARERRAAQCAMGSKEEALSVLGDATDEKYPIFMTGDLACLTFFQRSVYFSVSVKIMAIRLRYFHPSYLHESYTNLND